MKVVNFGIVGWGANFRIWCSECNSLRWLSVSPGPAGLLVVVLDGGGSMYVKYISHMVMVNLGTEGRSTNHLLTTCPLPLHVGLHSFVIVHVTMVKHGPEPLPFKFLHQFRRQLFTVTVQDPLLLRRQRCLADCIEEIGSEVVFVLEISDAVRDIPPFRSVEVRKILTVLMPMPNVSIKEFSSLGGTVTDIRTMGTRFRCSSRHVPPEGCLSEVQVSFIVENLCQLITTNQSFQVVRQPEIRRIFGP
jgi:hypothetical protein